MTQEGQLGEVDSTKQEYLLVDFDLDQVKKSRKDLLSLYLYGGKRYYYYKNERREHNFKPLVDQKNIIGAGKGSVLATREGFKRLKERIENLKIKLKQREVFYK